MLSTFCSACTFTCSMKGTKGLVLKSMCYRWVGFYAQIVGVAWESFQKMAVAVLSVQYVG